MSSQQPPYAEVTRRGRWYWSVAIQDGLTTYGPDGYGWLRFSRRGAERKGRRELARYMARVEPETFRVFPPGWDGDTSA